MFKKLGSIINPKTISTEMSALQASSSAAFAKNLKELEQFASTEAPKIAVTQKDALKGLDLLSRQVKAMIK